MNDKSSMSTIFIYPNTSRDKDLKITFEAVNIVRSAGLEPILPNSVGRYLDEVKQLPLEDGIRASDMVICIGGDGTILRIAKDAQRNQNLL